MVSDFEEEFLIQCGINDSQQSRLASLDWDYDCVCMKSLINFNELLYISSTNSDVYY